jgi:hypothetical protein
MSCFLFDLEAMRKLLGLKPAAQDTEVFIRPNTVTTMSLRPFHFSFAKTAKAGGKPLKSEQ